MDDTTKQKYLDEHIPYRMRFIEMLRFACGVLLAPQRPRKAEILLDGTSVLSADSIYFITNPFLEIGTLYCRVMLEFVGITCDQEGKTLIPKQRSSSKSRSRDLVIKDFVPKKVSVSDAVAVPFEKDTRKVEQALVSAVLLAHKGIAHLTVDPVESADLEALHLCSKVVPWLVCQYLYGGLGLPKPEYEFA